MKSIFLKLNLIAIIFYIKVIKYNAEFVNENVDFNKKVFADVSYRYRNTTSDELKWEANTAFVGIGYHINPTTTANIIYGNTFSGDYTSNSYTFALTKKFN
jgi:hypothetical protein